MPLVLNLRINMMEECCVPCEPKYIHVLVFNKRYWKEEKIKSKTSNVRINALTHLTNKPLAVHMFVYVSKTMPTLKIWDLEDVWVFTLHMKRWCNCMSHNGAHSSTFSLGVNDHSQLLPWHKLRVRPNLYFCLSGYIRSILKSTIRNKKETEREWKFGVKRRGISQCICFHEILYLLISLVKQ